MATFKFTVSDPEKRISYPIEIDQEKALSLIGKKIGDEFSGDIIGLPGYSLKITGGSDKDGFPMHPDVEGPGRRRILLTGPPGFHPRLKGERRRKTVCGNTIPESIAQINCKIVKVGEKPLEELLPKKEKPREEVKEKKPEEKPKEKERPEVKPVERKGGEGGKS